MNDGLFDELLESIREVTSINPNLTLPELIRLLEGSGACAENQALAAKELKRLGAQVEELEGRITVTVGNIDVDLLDALTKEKVTIDRQLEIILGLKEEINQFIAENEKLNVYLEMANEKAAVFYKHVRKRGHIIQTLQRKLHAYRDSSTADKKKRFHTGEQIFRHFGGWWECPECGPQEFTDEDGCCQICGRDTHPPTENEKRKRGGGKDE